MLSRCQPYPLGGPLGLHRAPFFAHPKCASKFASKKRQKSAKIIDFGFPKWIQNRRFFEYFGEMTIFQKSCSRRGESSIFKVWTLPKTIQHRRKIDARNVLFFNIDFLGFGLDFGASWASKSAALFAAPGVLNPTAFYVCIDILLFLA